MSDSVNNSIPKIRKNASIGSILLKQLYYFSIKKETRRSLCVDIQFFTLSTNRRSDQSHRCGLGSCQVKWEVVCVTLMHNFHSKTSTVQYICPGVQHTTLTIKDGLVEVETVQVECHRGDTKCGEPDAYNRPCGKEEVK